MKLKGKYVCKAVVLGDNIDTDAILPGKYLTITDERILAPHLFEGSSSIASTFEKDSIIIAGKNFGCGSSREGAPLAIKGHGILFMISDSYARIFYRNAVNLGLVPFECIGMYRATITGDTLILDMDRHIAVNKTRNREYRLKPIPAYIRKVIQAGGLISLVKKEQSRRKS